MSIMTNLTKAQKAASLNPYSTGRYSMREAQKAAKISEAKS